MNRRATDCKRIGPPPVVWDQETRYRAEQARQAFHTHPKGWNVLEAVCWCLLAVVLLLWGVSP